VNFLPLIESKREGRVLAPEQIQEFVRDFTAGKIPDYQMAALLMAIFFRGLNTAETTALTLAMRDSGEVLRFPRDARPLADKHSTGGIGDKVSLPLAPLLACLGFRVPMISGRGLGITGGTLDKLDSIPGFQTLLPAEKIVAQVQKIGCVICGQTDTMVPADKKIYALRDASGTVPSIPLITASILSKKLAENLDALILDVKFGCAAFMQTRADARRLARAMVALGTQCGTNTRALLTDMNTPLGRTAGNWLEVKESVACLEPRGADTNSPSQLQDIADLRGLVLESAAHLLVQTRKAKSVAAARALAKQCLASGAPRRKWDEMIVAQGADLRAFNQKLRRDSTARTVMPLTADAVDRREGRPRFPLRRPDHRRGHSRSRRRPAHEGFRRQLRRGSRPDGQTGRAGKKRRPAMPHSRLQCRASLGRRSPPAPGVRAFCQAGQARALGGGNYFLSAPERYSPERRALLGPNVE
jgi:pyrimidine-nucleoside phosphorylase